MARDPDEPEPGLGHAATVAPALADTPVLRRPGGDELATESISPQIGERPDADPLARAVARTRIANQLFARQDHVRVGRYHLLEQVGAGGMGVVWGAWDPELERRVAIKLIKATLPAARDRIQVEGQALAKLSHPNVVTVHDVGVVDDQIYIVMEWVRGENLRAYFRRRRAVREIVAIYRAAGEGLGAAHAAGLIHRDFKPDNAIRGDDGRVRVLDFGLARSDVRAADDATSSELTRGAGTPRYMPPEQAAGGALTAAVDQYALCMSLREALIERNADGKAADVPRWIDAIVARGTAADPAARFGSMAELVRGLGRDPATIWQRRLIVAGAALAAGVAFAVGSLHGGVEPCTGSQQDIAGVWNPGARARLVGHLQSLGAYGGGEAARLPVELGRYAERWAASHRTACTASERGELTAQLYERNLGCLGRARVGLETAIDLLSRVPGERLSSAIVAARGLPDTERCLTETRAQAVEPPPRELAGRAAALGNELARQRVLAQAADPAAPEAAAALVDRAHRLGYPPLVARAYLVQGLGLIARSDGGHAAPALEQAATIALDGGDQAAFVEAYAREVYAIAITRKPQLPEAAGAMLGAIPYVDRIAQRLGTAGSFERALLYNNIGVSRMSAGDRAGARGWFEKAAGEPRAPGGDVELVSALGNLALAVDPPELRDGLLAREHDTLVALLGADHIMTLEADYKRSGFAANPEAAAALTRDLCRRVAAFHAHESPGLLGQCAYQLGWLAEERGDTAETRSAMQQVTGLQQPIAAAYLAAADGRLDDAIRAARHAADDLQTEWWRKFYAGDARLFAAVCADRLHRTAEAIADARAALATYGEVTVNQHAPYYLRRTSRTRALLARLLAPSSSAESRALAAEAAAWYRAAGGYDGVTAELAAIAERR
jgi:hypothetical protein